MNNTRKIDARFIARTGIFAAISVILYCVPLFQIKLPIFPEFLELHFDEIPALIAGFAYGPLSALFIIIIKTLVKLPMTHTMCIGELCDLVYSCVFIIPATFIYKKLHTFKGAIISIILGIVIQVVVASILTTYVVLDLYVMFVPFITNEAILTMCQAVNPAIDNLGVPFLFMVALPFNALKDFIVGLVTILVYKKLHKLIDRIGGKKPEEKKEDTEEKEAEKN